MRKRSPKQNYRLLILILWLLVIIGIIWYAERAAAPAVETMAPTTDAATNQIVNDAKNGTTLQGSSLNLGVNGDVQQTGKSQ